MSYKRREKKSEMIEVRVPHSKKEAFKDACEKNGVSVSEAVRSFIDGYIRTSQRSDPLKIAQEIPMTILRNPLKTGSIGGALAAVVAVAGLASVPSVAETYVAPLELPQPDYPNDMIKQGLSAKCTGVFDISGEGYVFNLKVDCDHPGFIDSAHNAIATLKFEPLILNGEPVVREGVTYPLEYMLVEDAPETVKANKED